MTRQCVLQQLAERIMALHYSHPLRVAINGIDASGKTTLADELALLIEGQGRSVIRASIDDFQRPRVERYRQGPESAQGYYEDAFDYSAFTSALLQPLGPAGNRYYRQAVFDVHADTPLASLEKLAPDNAILLCDGFFLLRSELKYLWDYRIFVQVDFSVALQRAVERDQSFLGHAEVVRERYLKRYFPGQQLYFQRDRPQEQADIVFDNNNPALPLLCRTAK